MMEAFEANKSRNPAEVSVRPDHAARDYGLSKDEQCKPVPHFAEFTLRQPFDRRSGQGSARTDFMRFL
jgi:hypothetical protein